MAVATLEGLREYAVVAGDAFDGELTMCLRAAKAYFTGGGAEDPDASDLEYPADYCDLYRYGVYRLATNYYHHRTDEVSMKPIETVIAQLKPVKELIQNG